MATAAAMPDMKVTDPSSLAAMTGTPNIVQARTAAENKATRADATRNFDPTQSTTAPIDMWLLPMQKYTIAAPFGNSSALSQGVELLAPEGTPFYAVHKGVVTLARWNAGYGYAVIINVGNGVELVYGHASKLLVHEGQQITAGDVLGLSGNTGLSFEPNMHFEVRVNGSTTNPIAFLNDHQVNLAKITDMLTETN